MNRIKAASQVAEEGMVEDSSSEFLCERKFHHKYISGRDCYVWRNNEDVASI
jgi:hypothetical protein